ncbi:TadE/TadG family type IV pilus assembly protein [Methylocucumis oryzae]|uniref:TadE-like domain-containing protein n=1 Tax=Methylocucumis oryzae TaxID=1632867 RepID=A0A0F3IGR3_9GAMM|nr:TadE family protein [Methylocucumis oryzae]KJV05892.1 hypothetical protein VZ94_14925 [Methylocucumis oryzae]
MMCFSQRGSVTVEFALAGALCLMLIFAAVECARLLFTWNSLADMTQRGARAAAVCPPFDDAISGIAVFNDPTSSGISQIIPGLDTSHIQVEYLDAAGNAGAAGAAIQFVKVSINGYEYTPVLLGIFGLNAPITPPDFAAIVPKESLGALPDPDNPAAGAVITPCA